MHIILIPRERVGVLIGQGGEVKRQIEERGVKLEISPDGEVKIHDEDVDSLTAMAALSVVTAIGRGFSSQRAIRLFQPDVYLELVDIKDYAGKDSKDARRLKARLIGTKGKMKSAIEELTDTKISVYGHTVAIIGDIVDIVVAREGIGMILRGSAHNTVYHFLQRKQNERLMTD